MKNPLLPQIAEGKNPNKLYTTSHLKVAYVINGELANLCEHQPVNGEMIALFTFDGEFVALVNVKSDKANIIKYEVVEKKEDIEKTYSVLKRAGIILN